MFHTEDTVELEITEEDLKAFPDELEELPRILVNQVLSGTEGTAEEDWVNLLSPDSIDFDYLRELDKKKPPTKEEILRAVYLNSLELEEISDQEETDSWSQSVSPASAGLGPDILAGSESPQSTTPHSPSQESLVRDTESEVENWEEVFEGETDTSSGEGSNPVEGLRSDTPVGSTSPQSTPLRLTLSGVTS